MQLCSRAAHVFRLAAAIALGVFVSAAEIESPKQRHAAVLARALSYELTLEERVGDSVGVAIVYQPGDAVSKTNADDWLRAFQDLAPVNVKSRRLVAELVPYSQNELLATIDKGADVLLVTEGLDALTATIAHIARAKHVLTAGNSPDYVQTDLTICVHDEEGKSKILINLNAANQEHIRFGSRLLVLATLIR